MCSQEKILSGRGLQTHFYDGKMEIINFLKPQLDYARNVPIEEKLSLFEECEEFFVRKPIQALVYRILVGDIKNGRCNYDTENKVYVEDILFLVCEKLKDENSPAYFNVVLEQLTDMRSGMCVQGRTTRLLQTYYMFEG